MKPWPFGRLQMFGYDLLVVDPPWDFVNYSEAGTKKGADPHYSVMSLDAIKALPVGEFARGDCLLLLWTCGWMRPSDREGVLSAWGFANKSEIAWRKTTRIGKVRVGTGYRVRNMHETLYLGTIGNPRHRPFDSLFDGLAREHSRKPDEFYARVDRCCPGLTARADIFSRTERAGWATWGHETGKFGVAA